uniref:Uncharacterized protein n=1 Tax=Oryza nivara TaxID=4536 RepID=A0A0E0I4X7_ORYNI
MSKRYNAVILIQELQSLLFCKFNFWHSILYFFVSAEGSALFLRDIKLVLLLRQLAMDNNADVSTPTLLSISALVGDVTNLSAEESRRRQQREINNSLKVEAWNEYTFLGCANTAGSACKKRVKASSLDNVKAQCHMILEDKRIELKEYLNDLCHDKHKVIDNICKKYELENIEITNAKKQKYLS